MQVLRWYDDDEEDMMMIITNIILFVLMYLSSGEMVLEMGKEVVLSITVVNENESAYDAGLYVTSPASLKYIAGSSLVSLLL